MIRRSFTAAGVAALVVTASAAAGAAPHVHSRPAAQIPTPMLVVTGTTTGSGHHQSSSISVAGPSKFSAGRVDLELDAVGGEQEISIVRLKPGHTLAQVKREFSAFFAWESHAPNAPSKRTALRDLNRVVRQVVFYGGLDTGSLHSITGSVVLDTPGKYLLLNDENGAPSQPHQLIVTPAAGERSAPASDATVRATTAKRWAGASVLPHAGTVTFENASTQSPHFWVLIHVKKGTTRHQVVAYSAGNSHAAPPWALKDNIATDVLGMGKSQTLTYSLPKGTYAELCFFPDLKTGMAHAAMGMVRIVTLT